MGNDLLKERYLREAANFRILEAKEEKALLLLSLLRLLIFLGGIPLVWFAFTKSLIAGSLLLPALTALFLYMLKLYSGRSEKKAFLANLVSINRNEAAALTGDLSSFDDGKAYSDAHHWFSNDLDLFGQNSLFQYLNRSVTSYGRDILAGWLGDPFILSDDLLPRQEAIRELAQKEKWRHEFMASGMKKTLDKEHIARLTAWLNEEQSMQSPFLKFILIRILPSATLLSLLLVVTAVIPYTIFIYIFLFNLMVVSAGLKKTNRIHLVLTGMHNYLSSVYQLLKVFDKASFESVLLSDIRQNIVGNKGSAAVSVKKLTRLIEGFDTRLNIIAGFVLNGLLLWDYHCIYRLGEWKSMYRKVFPIWIGMLGKMDAFVSLGNFAGNNGDYTYPEISGDSVIFNANSVGHPLIDDEKRVCNDFILEHSGNVCIISGANMSGKSTFLRTIAVNYILAMTGAPVCAKKMIFTPLKLFTSMRTTDSLSENESYFYAELKRLKLLKSEIERGEPLLFILDEILKGTNSADKSLGSRLLMKRIVELGGTGLIATHDVSLGDLEAEYPGVVFNKCFEIEIEGEIIRFDYKIQDGITRKMNAAILMKQMGILE